MCPSIVAPEKLSNPTKAKKRAVPLRLGSGEFRARLPEEYYEEEEEREERSASAKTLSDNTIAGLSEEEMVQYAMMLSIGEGTAPQSQTQASAVHHLLKDVEEDTQFEWAMKQSMRT